MVNKSHIELLHGMHEGLLIVKKDTHSKWLFCNRPAGKLITTFLGNIDDCKDSSEMINAHKLAWIKNGFRLIKMDEENLLKNHGNTESKELELFNLDKIVLA